MFTPPFSPTGGVLCLADYTLKKRAKSLSNETETHIFAQRWKGVLRGTSAS